MALFIVPASGAQDHRGPPATNIGVPFYPPLARVANVEGVVHVKVTTNGSRVTTAHAEDGPKVLADAAEENVRTWRFLTHDPITFTVTYRFRIVNDIKAGQDNPRVVLQLPREVEVDIQRWPRTVDMPAEAK
jgi:hypothetical protein